MVFRSFLAVLAAASPAVLAAASGSAIFIHPDGAGIAHWTAARYLAVGPDGQLQWDQLPNVAVYNGPMSDALSASSNGGATTHAWGVRVPAQSFGMDGKEPLTALAGVPRSVMQEALLLGKSAGVINSATIYEPGSACFLTSVPSRRDYDEIAAQLVASGAQVLLGGGEEHFLPKGARGRHGPGQRADQRNLVAEARAAGYAVIFTRDELLALPAGTERVLGLFAAGNTFNDEPEEVLQRAGLPLYQPQAPSIAEMVTVALRLLSRNPKGFLLVAEEEATDNFPGVNNAAGTIEATLRADAALGVAREFLRGRSDTLLLVAADSVASGPHVVGPRPDQLRPDDRLPPVEESGAAVDGAEGTESRPFLAAPDARGRRLPFYISWAGRNDGSGGVVVRAEGFQAERVRGTMSNVEVYRALREAVVGPLPK